MTTTEHHDPAEATAPPVVAAVVTREAGAWLDEALISLAAQDYPNLSVLVIDAGATDGTLERVAAVLPNAYVRRLPEPAGFAAAANDVLEVVEGSTFYLLLHDDVALAPDAVRLLVEEAYRSNAGIVGPKLVQWDSPDRLLHVGMSADKVAVAVPLVDRGELDQEQHDAVRDVFVIPSGATLVRSDLFDALGGFDTGLEGAGEDVDLCWRAQVAGARVVVVPDAKARHLESAGEREVGGRVDARNRLRTVLTCYGLVHLLRVLPQAALLGMTESLHGLLTGRRREVGDQLAAWTWNLRRLGELRARRARLKAVRRLPDAEVRRLQVGGSARLRGLLRGEHAGDIVRASLGEIGRGFGDAVAGGPARLVLGSWLLVVVIVLFGSRDLLLGRIPWVGSLVPFDEGPFDLLRTYLSGWREAGLGGQAPQPTALALLGVAGTVLLGATGLLQQLLVLGMIPIGILGAWRLTRHLGSSRARAVGIVVYASIPLPYDALSRGSWAGLLVYGASPWILQRLLAATGEDPVAGEAPTKRWRPVLVLGVLVALLAAFVPLAVLLVPVVAVAIWLGGLLAGGARTAARAVGVAAGASVVAIVLNLPWAVDFILPGSEWWSPSGVAPLSPDRVGMGELLRFELGPVGVSSMGWALPVACALALVIGRGWRFTWAVRCWCIALACWALAWVDGQGLLGVSLPPADVLLGPAAAALALSAALGMAAFESDLRGYRFGWRQVVSTIAAACVAIGAIPVALAAFDGRWDLPDDELGRALSFVESEEVLADGPFRVLWLGDPTSLPVAGFRYADEVAYSLTESSLGGLADRWASPAYGPTPLVADAVRTAADRRTDRLGRLLAPFGVRYVVLAQQAAPSRSGARAAPLPPGLVRTVGQQLDLRRLDIDEAVLVWENAAWAPTRRTGTGGTGGLDDAATTDLTQARPALEERKGTASFAGDVPVEELTAAYAADAGWTLTVDGAEAQRADSGWASSFVAPATGEGTLRFETSPLRWLIVFVQALLWLGAIAAAWRTRRPRTTSLLPDPGPSYEPMGEGVPS